MSASMSERWRAITSETRGKVWKECWDRGVAVLSCGPQSIRFRPPLVFSRENVDQTLATLRTALELVAQA